MGRVEVVTEQMSPVLLLWRSRWTNQPSTPTAWTPTPVVPDCRHLCFLLIFIITTNCLNFSSRHFHPQPELIKCNGLTVSVLTPTLPQRDGDGGPVGASGDLRGASRCESGQFIHTSKQRHCFWVLSWLQRREVGFTKTCVKCTFLTTVWIWYLTESLLPTLPQSHPRKGHHGWVPGRFLSHSAPYLDPHTPHSDTASRTEPGPLGLHPGCRQQFRHSGGQLWRGPESVSNWWPASLSREGLDRAVAAEQGGGGRVREPVQGSDRLHVLPP